MLLTTRQMMCQMTRRGSPAVWTESGERADPYQFALFVPCFSEVEVVACQLRQPAALLNCSAFRKAQ
jgi:hypothetical protein